MRYHNITTDDMLNGEGLRTVLWTAGCGHQCKGCQNPVTWDPEGGLLFDETAEEELFAKLGKDYISGLTFSGGDPLFPASRAEVEISALPIMAHIDVLVDGKFMEDLKDSKLHWKGSFNQRIIDVQKSLKNSALYFYTAE